jgi:hypothetical protein
VTKKLFINNESKYGTDYKNHFLEQYKLYLESIEKTSDRRQSANNYFLTINTILISILAIAFETDSLINIFLLKIFIPIIGVFFCIVFGILINSYKQLNTGKFSVLHEVESKLPISLYQYEWEILGEGKDKKKYYPFSHVELVIPCCFGFVYIVLFILLSLPVFPSIISEFREFISINRSQALPASPKSTH